LAISAVLARLGLLGLAAAAIAAGLVGWALASLAGANGLPTLIRRLNPRAGTCPLNAKRAPARCSASRRLGFRH
jgi:hypothetical protein